MLVVFSNSGCTRATKIIHPRITNFWKSFTAAITKHNAPAITFASLLSNFTMLTAVGGGNHLLNWVLYVIRDHLEEEYYWNLCFRSYLGIYISIVECLHLAFTTNDVIDQRYWVSYKALLETYSE